MKIAIGVTIFLGLSPVYMSNPILFISTDNIHWLLLDFL
jgi:hypothetical protein